MDAIVVGIGTALADNPLLTARPPGPRTAVRIVVDSEARLPLGSQVVRTAHEAPVIAAVSSLASFERCAQLTRAGVEFLNLDAGPWHCVPLHLLMLELGKRRMTHVLVEGGARVLGSCLDGQLIDEVHAFVSPALAGSIDAFTPIGGEGIALMSDALRLKNVTVTQPGGDVYVHGDVPRD